LNIPANITIP
jgi:hypothetical protein